MVRYLTEDNRAPRPAPITVDRDVAELVPRAVEEVLRRAESWLAWDGRPTHAHGNVWTPHKALRRVTDHLIEPPCRGRVPAGRRCDDPRPVARQEAHPGR